MYGYGYSVRQHFRFSGSELLGIFWTSLAFAFVLTFRKWGAGAQFDPAEGLLNLAAALILVCIAMLAHVSLQKLVAIRLGYKATYSYWLNGVLLSLLLGFISVGYLVFILPGATTIEHVPTLRLGKFRYGINLKDIARVALAGPIAHILIILILGLFYYQLGRPEFLLAFISINLLLAIYSMLPIPKIDLPTRMDSGSDGLAVFFFSRTLYVLTLSTVIVFAALVFASANYVGLGWLFVIAFIIGCALSIAYSIGVEQKN